MGLSLGLLPIEGRDLILAGALLSITLNPLMFAIVDAVLTRVRPRSGRDEAKNPRYRALQAELQATRDRLEARAAELRLEAQEFVTKFPMFASLSPEASEELHALFHARLASPGERLIRAGDRADAVFFISKGAVEVSVAGRKIQLGPGDVFGEMALLTGGRRTADVTAIDYCELLALERSDFRQFLRKYPQLRHQVDGLVAKRSEMNRQPAQVAKVET